MATPDENADDSSVEEEAVEDEKDQDGETDESDADGEDSKDGDESEDADGEEDADADDDDKKPVTVKVLKDFFRKERNRQGADRRTTSKKDGQLPGKPSKLDQKVDALAASIAKGEAAERKRQFGYENSLSPAEVDIVFRFNSKPSTKTLTDPILKGALDGYRTSQKSKQNMPSPTGRTYGGKGKSFSDLKQNEKEANFADHRRAVLDSKRGR